MKKLHIIIPIGFIILIAVLSGTVFAADNQCPTCSLQSENTQGCPVCPFSTTPTLGPCPPCLCPFEDGSCTMISLDGNQAMSIRPSFTADKTTGTVPITVQFTDTSSGSPNIWGWDFGDGTNSALQNPLHTYTFPGNYSVTFMAKRYTKEGTTESTMAASIVKPDYIVVTGQTSVSPTSSASVSASVMGSSSTPVQPPSKSDQVMGIPKILQPVITVPYIATYPVQAYYPATSPAVYVGTPYQPYYESAASVPTVVNGKPITMALTDKQVMPNDYGNNMTIPFPFLLQYSLKGFC